MILISISLALSILVGSLLAVAVGFSFSRLIKAFKNNVLNYSGGAAPGGREIEPLTKPQRMLAASILSLFLIGIVLFFYMISRTSVVTLKTISEATRIKPPDLIVYKHDTMLIHKPDTVVITKNSGCLQLRSEYDRVTRWMFRDSVYFGSNPFITLGEGQAVKNKIDSNDLNDQRFFLFYLIDIRVRQVNADSAIFAIYDNILQDTQKISGKVGCRSVVKNKLYTVNLTVSKLDPEARTVTLSPSIVGEGYRRR